MGSATASSRRFDSVVTVAVAGDVDLSAGPLVDKAISEAVATAGVTAVQVDISDVQFLDSSGIGMLLKGRRSADAHQVGYRVTGAHGITERILRLTGVWTHLTGDTDDPATP